MPSLDLDGISLAYQRYPADHAGAPLVLLLHGLGSRSDDWVLQIDALRAAGYQVLAPDLRGLGRSSSLQGWPNVEDLADDMISLLKDQTRGPVHVVGLSLGGTVALAIAARSPEVVKSLVLVNTFAHLTLRAVNWRNALGRGWNLFVGSMDRLGEWIAEDLFPRDDQSGLREAAAERIAANERASYLKLLVAVARFDIRRELQTIDKPTLVVAGSADNMVPIELKQYLAERIPGAELLEIEGSGHATPVDAAERFNDALIGFLERAEERRDKPARATQLS